MSEVVVTEVPTALKQLARLVSRGFYSIEDSLLVDLLVRNPCMKEEDICELLKLEKKQLRSRIATLKADKFIQVRMKVETGADGKAQRVNYFYVNYKSFVNVVKYKLDHIRRKLDTRERDETNRASFQCKECAKTFTDLEVDQLYNFETNELCCTYCNGEVTESQRGDSGVGGGRLSLQRFNEQTEQLFLLLKEVENVKLSAELLNPDPTDIDALNKLVDKSKPQREGVWSGEATRKQGLVDDTSVKISFGGADGEEDPTASKTRMPKDRPIWMTESTVFGGSSSQSPNGAGPSQASAMPRTAPLKMTKEDILSFLMVHEGPASASSTPTPAAPAFPSMSSPTSFLGTGAAASDEDGDEEMDDEDDDGGEGADDAVPLVSVGSEKVPLASVDASMIARMTQAEKDEYIRLYQDHFSHMYD